MDHPTITTTGTNNNTSTDTAATTTTTTTTTSTNHNSTEERKENEEASLSLSLQHQSDRALEEIERITKETQVLTSQLYPLLNYLSSSSSNDNNNNTTTNNNYQTSIHYLINQKQYTHYRAIRGDGNCYYRAFLYSLIEQIIIQRYNNKNKNNNNDNDDEGLRIYDWLKTDSYQTILSIGQYNEMTIELFYDTFIDLLERILHINNNNNNNNTTTTTKEAERSLDELLLNLHNEMNLENSTSDYCTWYLRVITATYLKSDPERFLPFLLVSSSENRSNLFCDNSDPYTSIQQYCTREVEPMGKECEQIHILALAEAFHVQVQIEYLDGRNSNNNNNNYTKDEKDATTTHIFGPTSSTATTKNSPLQLTFLYRPGHYDILYRK